MILGFGTGSLYKTHDRLKPETFDIHRQMGCNAIELMWHATPEETNKLLALKKDDLRGFSYRSLHLPSDIGHMNISALHETLEIAQKVHGELQFNCIVLHPNDMERWDVISQYPDLPIAVENMDWRAEHGKYVESLESIFEKFDAPMVLDLNHCFTNDPSMLLAHDMVKVFGSRIVEIHVSGFETAHEPLVRTMQEEILRAIPDKNLPIIIESVCEGVGEAKREYEFVKNYLEK